MPEGIARAVLTPSQLNALARSLLEDTFPLIWVEGELSGVSRPASGHLYFTLKDARAQVRCAMFKPKSSRLAFRPVDGMQVMLRARLTVYEARGDYQLLVEHMEEAGEGALLRAFELLKATLAAEGLFDTGRKRALPRFVRRLGLLTSPSGAAARDVVSILRRRFPLIEVELLPVPVQGATAAAALRDMLARADRSGRYDVLLLTRGGGSLEDLQAFNDEALARAIAASGTPVVSAVGHEVDTSIADFASDLRAATPSAAAELLVPDRIDLALVLRRRLAQAHAAWARDQAARSQALDHLMARLQAQRPAARLQRNLERLSALAHALQLQLDQALQRRRERHRQLGLRLRSRHPRERHAELRRRLRRDHEQHSALLLRMMERRALQLRGLARALNAVNPLATLDRGYAILRDPETGRVLRMASEARLGQRLDARLGDGTLSLEVLARPDDAEPGAPR